MEVEIRDDLPIPKDNRRGRKYRFPFDELKVSQAFIVRGMKRNTLSPYKAYAERHLGKTFTTRSDVIDGRPAVIVWRVT